MMVFFEISSNLVFSLLLFLFTKVEFAKHFVLLVTVTFRL